MLSTRRMFPPAWYQGLTALDPRFFRLVAFMLLAGAVLHVLTIWLTVRAIGGPIIAERGPFSVHRVRCGMSRPEGERRALVRLTFVDAGQGRLPPGTGIAFVDAGGVVVGVAGLTLESDNRVLLRAGDTLGKVRQILGPPRDQRHQRGMGTRGVWIYPSLQIQVEYTGDVVDRIILGERIGDGPRW